ncbi:hypothetical protein [Rhodospirillum sp. A1_3_36]|uniref:hypothetical protein n=1 Tax=Rhodospirillum sp. A1_3_36 TaxID=3391666 RepID=UPI0039A60954
MAFAFADAFVKDGQTHFLSLVALSPGGKLGEDSQGRDGDNRPADQSRLHGAWENFHKRDFILSPRKKRKPLALANVLIPIFIVR